MSQDFFYDHIKSSFIPTAAKIFFSYTSIPSIQLKSQDRAFVFIIINFT